MRENVNPSPGLEPVNLEEDQDPGHGLYQPWRAKPPHPDAVRQTLAFSLVALLVLIVLGTLISFIANWLTLDEMKELNILITPVLTITGTAVGFYFGSSGAGAK